MTCLKKNSHFCLKSRNKGLDFFFPPRSMVLKVVRGKILETLKLHWFSAVCNSFPEVVRKAGTRSKCFAFIEMGLGWPRLARRREPAVHDKKTLVSAQNLENKGPDIFLPPRSMVLKIVRGKILETLELACFQRRVVPFWHRAQEVRWSDSAGERSRSRVRCQVVKDR
jgi:hypothetical protein